MTRRIRGAFALLAISWLLAVGSAPAALAQEGPVIELDLGTFLLDDLAILSPSSMFRPLDMAGVRAGARGWGMGGAYAADARGVEAVAWNPAGLGWLERADFSGDLAWTTSSGTTTGFPDTFNIPQIATVNVTRYEVNLKARVRYSLLGAAMAFQPFGSARLAGALSFRRYLDLSYPEEIVEDLSFQEAGSFPVTLAFDGDEKGGVDAAAASLAFQAVPGFLSIGGTLNVLDGRLKENQEQIIATGGGTVPSGLRELRFDYRGLSGDFGIQVRREGLFAFGARYTPRYTLEVTGGQWSSRSLSAPGQPILVMHGKVAGYDMEVPSLVTVAASGQPLPWLLVAAQMDRQKWSETRIAYRDSDEPDAKLPLKNVTTIGGGVEARLLHIRRIELPLRLGYRQGPLSVAQLEPRGNPLFGDWTGGEVDSKTISLGIGMEASNLRYDLSYEFTDYEIKKFYFDVPFDALVNPHSEVVNVDRRVAILRLSATLAL
jgi:hypothetical protein